MNISWKKSVELSAVYCVGKLFLADAKVAKKQPHLDELAKCEAPKDAGDWRNCLDSISARESESVNLGDFSTDVESCTSAFEKCFPKFNDEIKIRSQPLQSMFAFEGPGLFRLTCQLAGLKPPEHATVWLAQPVSAGGGISLLPNALGPQAII
ncbi:MAG TPA: hypothetical protein DDW52_10815, partial [Planctomycetaceae bacterium]|nr:hypothetical protein [Planctomycetaceae bacterium]